MRLAEALYRPIIEAVWLGRISYADGLTVQKKFIEKLVHSSPIASDFRNYMLLLEHTPVYTVGLRSHFYSEEEENRLKRLGADFHRTDRGGLITFHGPGQLVAYPIMNLSSLSVREPDVSTLRVGVRRFVDLIEEAIIRTVCKFGLHDAARSPHTGVWVGNGMRKLAAIGINVRQGITSHGLALNCNTDMKWFHQIVPCGLVGKDVTSLSSELNKDVKVNEVIQPFSKQFAEVFQSDLIFAESHEDTAQPISYVKNA